ncbi:MAG: hypothetical protein WD226_06400 [Planctomycetota bacterium]
MVLVTLIPALLVLVAGQPPALAPIVCTPSSVSLPGTPARASASPIEDAIVAAKPGQSILLDAGDYSALELGFQRQARLAGGSIGGQAGLPVIVEGRGQVRIRGQRGDAIAIHQDVRTAHILFRGLEIHPGTRAGVMFFRQPASRRHVGFHFEDCHILGQYSHLDDAGQRSKWGVWGHQLDDFRFIGMQMPARIQDIALEHAFYLQNPVGEMRIENVHGRRLGRTFLQVTARKRDGPLGVGDVIVRNCRVEDVGIARRDGFKGGSAFTITGRLTGTVFFEQNVFRAGFDPALRKLKRPGQPYGTGAFVAWMEPEAEGVQTKLLVLRDNDFRFAEHCGDRPVVSIGGCRDVRIVGTNHFASGGAQPALSLDPVDELGQLAARANGTVFVAPLTTIEGPISLRGQTPSEAQLRQLHGHP